MRATLFLLFTILWHHAFAQQKPFTDSISACYAADSNATAYRIIRFKNYPNHLIQQYEIVKTISPLHYIVKRTNNDTALVYNYPASANWKATTLLLHTLQHTTNITIEAGVTTTPAYCHIIQKQKNIIIATVIKEDWPLFIAQDAVQFADVLRKPVTETRINSADPSANAINTAQQHYPTVNGHHIIVSLKEHLFDTTDIDLAGRQLPSSLAAIVTDSHATIMATMIAGAGNSDIKGLGAAPAAKLSSVNFESLLPEDSTYFSQGIAIQNHSYGTGIENYYGIEAQAYDEQVYQTDTVLQVFSSGNIGDQADNTGSYAGVAGYANLSGTFKQAKNVLVVGGTDDSLHVPILSSGGPAYDGRVKPEIVAYGIDGTSGAAAVTSGTAALLQDAYLQQYNYLPPAALLKAMLINSAVTVSHTPLSYRSGYGSLNALNALNTLYAKQWFKGNGPAHFTIQPPPGTALAKITLCWNDPPAVLNAPKALVNDLDLSVTNAQGQAFLPWILNPLRDSLAQPPTRGRDTLNNVEQITIDQPAGALQINVQGPGQVYYIVYSFVPRQQFNWINPGEHEILPSGNLVPLPLRWQTNVSGKGDISCSYDKGNSWQTIASRIDAAQGLYYWQVPDTFSKALLKFSTADTAFISDTFYLSPHLALNTGYNCPDSALIIWQAAPTAALYEVFRLGAQYLLPFAQTTDTLLNIPLSGSPYYAVSPVHPEGWIGLKSDGTNYLLQGTACYFKTLVGTADGDSVVILQLSLGTNYQLQQISWERYNAGNFASLHNEPALATDYTYIDHHPHKDINIYRAKLLTSYGKVIYSDPVTVYLLKEDQFIIYPNPAYTNIRIAGELPDNRTLLIYDTAGRLRFSKDFYGTEINMDIGWLPQGAYEFVVLKEGKKVFSRLIIKQ